MEGSDADKDKDTVGKVRAQAKYPVVGGSRDDQWSSEPEEIEGGAFVASQSGVL